MFRLVEADPSTARERELGHASPTGLVEWALEVDPFAFQFFGRRVDVLTQQIELVTLLLVGRMDRNLRGGKRKMSQPPPESTESRPRTSLKNFRSASASWL